jgi:glycerol-3-phosphate acyltransferase PlsY
MDPSIVLITVVVSYLVGSISFARLFTRLLKPDADLENAGITSVTTGEKIPLRTMGATKASMELGSRWGCLIGIMDILKVSVPTLIFKLLFPGQPYFLVAAVFGMVGHNWPIYHRFQGGSGISSIYGGFIVIDFIGAFVCAFAGLFFGLVIVRDVLVAYLSGVWFMIPWLWFRTHDPAYLLYAIIVNLIFTLSLVPEIRDQIKAHREGRFEMQAAMESFPMGRGMLKIMERLRLKK